MTRYFIEITSLSGEKRCVEVSEFTYKLFKGEITVPWFNPSENQYCSKGETVRTLTYAEAKQYGVYNRVF